MTIKHLDFFKNFILKVAIPTVTFWSVLFLLRYPLPCGDDLFFIGSAINLAKGGEFTNSYIEAWNSVLSSGKFYFQPPFYSFVLAGWLKLMGISTTSLLLFQYLSYNIFSLFTALLLRFYGLPRITALCTTVLFAVWHCNPNPYYSTGFRQDALGMAYLALGLWLLTRDNSWRYFLGFSFVGGAVFTSPITVAYAVPFSISILGINLIHQGRFKIKNSKYFLSRLLALLLASGLVTTLFLLCIKFDLQSFLSDFLLHASFRRVPTLQAIPIFIKNITQYYGFILILPTYILFFFLVLVAFYKRYFIPKELKILFVALNLGIVLNILLYSSAIWFTFFFCWIGIVSIISTIILSTKMRLAVSLVALFIFFSSQTLNILSLVEREYIPEPKYRAIREAVLAKPSVKYAIDAIAARFVFDYKLPTNSTDWGFIKPLPYATPESEKDKLPDVTWIVSSYNLGHYVPEMLKDYPRVEFLGRKFNSLPKKPFDVIVVP